MNGVYTTSEHVSWRKLDAGRSIILDLRSGRYYTLNETATLAWEYLRRSLSVGEVVRQLAEAFEVDAAVVEQDVRDLVDNFVQKGFLTDAATSMQMPEADGITAPPISYVRPVVEEHEAVREVTAGSDDYSYSGYGSHYWYPN